VVWEDEDSFPYQPYRHFFLMVISPPDPGLGKRDSNITVSPESGHHPTYILLLLPPKNGTGTGIQLDFDFILEFSGFTRMIYV
jgi:hypothetical protein